MRLRTTIAAAAAATLILPLAATEASAVSPVRFSRVWYDSPGNDTGTNRSLNAEWIRVTNHAQRSKTLTGWTIRDPQRHVYRFPTFRLGSGRSVRIHTGAGRNTATDLYWRAGWYVWNNTGDRAILKNKAGTTVDTCTWRDVPGSASATNC